MKINIKNLALITFVVSALSGSSLFADDELGPALSLKLSGCVFTLDQFATNIGSEKKSVSEAYRIYNISGFSFEDLIFFKIGEEWTVYWRYGIRDKVHTGYTRFDLFKERYNGSHATELLAAIKSPNLWNQHPNFNQNAGDDGFVLVAAKWAENKTVYKFINSNQANSNLIKYARSFWMQLENSDTKTKNK